MHSIFSPFPFVNLAVLPTPIRPLTTLGKGFFVKQDNLSGLIYGGNKIRKLEFLLGEALARKHKTVLTYGAAGSNHALATALCCRQLGLRAISVLVPQETSHHVRQNLLMQCTSGAELHLCPDYTHVQEITRKLIAQHPSAPYIIPAGGTNATGALGFVSAAFELAKQIQPDVIYLPLGTGGTLAGLLVGLKLAGLKTRIEAIRVVDASFRNERHIETFCNEICARLNRAPIVTRADITIRNAFYGKGYGIATPAGREAVEQFNRTENMALENTYTGKTVAALLHDFRAGRLTNQTVLYWNTLNSHDLSAETSCIDYRTLPAAFHDYFETE